MDSAPHLGHPFLEAIIENCVRAQKDPAWVKPMMRGLPLLSKLEFYVLYTSGPGLVSRTLAENPELAKTVRVLFPDDVCDFSNWNRFGDFGIHLMDASWRLNKGRVRRRLAGEWEAWKLRGLLKESVVLGKTRQHTYSRDDSTGTSAAATDAPKPLVSILIPAHNAQEWIADTLRSAIAQTWERKEIIVVDDGSTDQTHAIARQFETHGVRVVRQENQGASAARNKAFSLSHGDYIQWLDADDLARARQDSQADGLAEARSRASRPFFPHLGTVYVPSASCTVCSRQLCGAICLRWNGCCARWDKISTCRRPLGWSAGN